jgi:cyclic beta-1,2-glucan synthetase
VLNCPSFVRRAAARLTYNRRAILKRIIARLHPINKLQTPWDSLEPIREELFSVERLETHARSLATAQAIVSGQTGSNPLASRLAANGAALLAAYRSISKAVDDGHAITPAAEWLIDNYHLVEKQFREVRSDLPPGFYRQLPKLSDGPFAGYPRVLGIAWAFVAHTDSRFDVEMLRRFILAYQEVQPLTIGELWALSVTLRVVLVENLRRLADRTLENYAGRKAANYFADRMLGTNGNLAEAVSKLLSESNNLAVSNAFAVQVLLRLHDQDARIIPAITWLTARLASKGATPDQVVSDEHLRQGAATVTVSNIINSLRMIGSVDWFDVFESISLVNKILATDPAFPDMDFATRDLYRNAIEELARGSKLAEIEIARRALAPAGGATGQLADAARHNGRGPGYCLIGKGREGFEKAINFHTALPSRLKRAWRWLGIRGYVGGIAMCSAGFLSVALFILSGGGVETSWLVLLGLLGAIPITDSAVSLVNCAINRAVWPLILPALELKDGIPANMRTLVAVPTLLTSIESVAAHIENLEVHHLASPDGEVYFAVLSDWVDAPMQEMPGDAALLEAAVSGIVRLNERYPAGPAGSRFLLLHRPRSWTKSEGSWIGWERKRGKLHQLNRFLRGATDTGFIAVDGAPPRLLADVRYVITLDADTRLPRETVRKLIGKMAHPLNTPHFDALSGRVVEGYGILQPRITPSLPVGEAGSLFQRTFSSQSGIDPYAAAVSDVYQDLFDEGSFAGKGIYDVDAFEAALAGRVPESTLLSHDLFEGVFARAGLASDVEVVEEFPARYDVSALRHHRWVRGDWQLLPWIFGRVSTQSGNGTKHESIPGAGRWKMIDNLRRSLSAPMAVAALMAGWFLPFNVALIWTLLVLAAVVTPTIIPILCTLTRRPPGVPFLAHLRTVVTDLSFALTQSLFVVVFLADQAWLMGDAIVRTLFRLWVTRAYLLEWVSHAQTAVSSPAGFLSFTRRMAGALVLGLAAFNIAFFRDNDTWWLAAPFALLWIASPAIALWASLPPTVAGRPFAALWRAFPGVARWASLSPVIAGQLPVTEADARALRLTARRTWRFFETFVTVHDNMLPPDNFQEEPVSALAHRTSPTNLGLYLLSIVSARDFGWIGTRETVERLEATLATMRKMERVRGHFYNWYDTQTLYPLEPKYISTVDSGNLAGHLIVLARACSEWNHSALEPRMQVSGITDAIELAILEAKRLYPPEETHPAECLQIQLQLAAMSMELSRLAMVGTKFIERLARLAVEAEKLRVSVRALSSKYESDILEELQFWVLAVYRSIQSHLRDRQNTTPSEASLAERLNAIDATARNFALAMEFGFLLDEKRKLLSIGYLVHEDQLDPNCYDLVASEARLASFFAIAKGDIPARHWFRLDRAVVLIARRATLISWSGSMFEYLMPSLVMRAPTGSLIEQTSRLIVRRQIDYGKSRGVPWGISESAYNVRDLEFTYQYSTFGIPDLGLKRGLDANIVVAPYATALAAMVDPRAAVQNFERITNVGGVGRFGFYEALDYTPVRLPEGETVAVVKAFMAHHQGMTIIAIANALLDAGMRTRFHAEPIVQATELLLQERPPRDVVVARRWDADAKSAARIRNFELPGGRHFSAADRATPATHLLSNGQYSVMLTSAGSGYSRWKDIAVTRWREDSTCDDWGSYLFLRDIQNESIWSAGFQPCGVEPDEYNVIFDEDRAIFTRRDGTLTTTMEVLVSGEDDAEVRHISVVNDGRQAREIEVTSYAELALTTQAADLAHPVFSKLFVQTEYLPEVEAIVATRRRRTSTEPEIWVAHLAVVAGETMAPIEIETDRARFIGRNGKPGKPYAIIGGRALTNTTGTVLDPVFAMRHKVRIAPGSMIQIAYWTMVAPTRQDLLDCIDKHRDSTAFARTATLAWTRAQVQLHHIGIDPVEAALFQRLAEHLLFASPGMRSSPGAIARGAGSQNGLWSLSISGDLPILLLRIADADHLDLVRQLLVAHEYWRMKHASFDLVILNERAASYVQDLQIALEGMVRTSQSRRQTIAGGASGGVFVVRADLMSPETRALLNSVARVVLVGQRGTLVEQLDRAPMIPARTAATRIRAVPWTPQPAPPIPELEFFNGHGGFADGGREYVIVLASGKSTPAPWINVIANPAFGFQVSAEGGGYTWSVNSRENQLTPWSNDPVSDRPGEVIYLRDEDTREIWSATAEPVRDQAATYVTRHGRGYSRFEHASHEIAADLTQFVPLSDPVKISRLTLRNLSGRPRRLSVTAYAEWVLGPSRSTSAPFITTSLDQATGALFARNAWTPAFAGRIAFLDMSGLQTEWTGDRRAFIGRNGTLANPAAMGGAAPLAGAVGAGLDPCGAMRATITLAPGETSEIAIFLGQAASADEAQTLIGRYRDAKLDDVMSHVRLHWEQVLEAIQVNTPDRSMDIMLNGWLLYQTLACRVWARSAFYQASGAYGFRDQLQDGMALVAIRPDITRAHLLRAAARQFVEGDVQHWWWPNTGQGVRTRITDDRAWLAYAAVHYIDATGDGRILDENVGFLEGQWLREGEHDSLFQPVLSDASASLFEHCALALDQSLALGVHGLPLMGSGDWNDGMNRVGEHGQGESVWLAWLHCATLVAFAAVAEARGEAARAAKWRGHAEALRKSIEREAWDGEWYRRGYYDDGAPLGSATSEECQLDSIAQSWAVISGAADSARARQAMSAVERELILPAEALALLFKPPFDKTTHDPGYIKGYPPGIRENGGQYTHGALWSVIAFAMLGQGEKAARLFSILNPINHARTPAEAGLYIVEPYVVAADVYAKPPHVGRGGWTWYTGSAGWMQRAGVESILGLRVQAGVLQLNPCIPHNWPGFSMCLKHGSARYEIHVANPEGVSSGIVRATVDGTDFVGRPLRIAMADDGATHDVMVTLG